MSRHHSPKRCPGCSIFHRLCLCEELQPHALSTYVSILMHVRENSLTTNTARLMHKLLTHSRILLRGSPDGPMEWSEPPPWNSHWSNQGNKESGSNKPALLFLFPGEKARDLQEVLLEVAGRPIHLIVPDGNWKQCAKVRRRLPVMDQIYEVKLPPGAQSEFLLRKEPRPECVSTFEAIARALGTIENPELSKTLMEYFHKKQDRLLYARGLKKEKDVFGGIPASGRKPWH